MAAGDISQSDFAKKFIHKSEEMSDRVKSDSQASNDANVAFADHNMGNSENLHAESAFWRFPEGSNPTDGLENGADNETTKNLLPDEVLESFGLTTIKADAPKSNVIEFAAEELITLTSSETELLITTEQTQETTPEQHLLETVKLEANTSVSEDAQETEDAVVIAQINATQTGAISLLRDGAEPNMPTSTPVTASRETNIPINTNVDSADLREVEIDTIGQDIKNLTDIPDLDIDGFNQTSARSDVLASQNLFPSSTQMTGQPIIGLGMELAAPSVVSGTTSVINATPATSVGSSAISNAIVTTVADAILTAKETPKGVMVQLDPPEMGRVYIDFLFDADSRVTVVVKAENPESYNILRERSQEFMQMLNENGFSNVDLSFERQSADGEARSDQDNSQSRELNIGFSDAASDALENSYRTPIYKVNEEQLRLDLRL